MAARDAVAAGPHSNLRIWGLTAVVVAVTSTVWWAVDFSTPNHLDLHWLMVAVAFGLIELGVIHIHFRGEAYSFSLGEVALVAGILYASPMALVLGQIIGAAAALVFHRRQPAIKTAFNVANFAFNTTVALVAFEVLYTGGDPLSPRNWFAFFGAAVAAAATNVLLIGMAISLAEGSRLGRKAAEVSAFGLVVAVTNTSLALCGLRIVRTEPWTAVLLAVMATTLLAAYRAYASERRHNESLEFLYESVRAFSGSGELGTALAALLENARAAFSCRLAEAVLFPSDESGQMLRTRVPADDPSELMEVVGADEARRLQAMAAALHRPALIPGAGPAEFDGYFAALGVADGMVTRLEGDGRTVGLLLVGGRLSDVSPLLEHDLRLFGTVASNAALSLENDQLETAVLQLRELENQLSHQANHDSLTGLVVRGLFIDLVDAAIQRDRRASILFIDLDDFKYVNDTLGHASGDNLLRAVADRLRSCLREGDAAARLGGDEFAVLLADGGQDAERVAVRIIDALSEPICVGAEEARVGCSIGIASGTASSSAGELIRKADAAMYSAKAGGKGRFLRFEPGMFEAQTSRNEMHGRLADAIAREEFTVHFQPTVSLATSEIVGAEALVRWHTPDRGIVSAGQFMDIAEETGQSVAIGNMAIRQAALVAGALARCIDDPVDVAVNVSGRQLQQTDVHQVLASAIEESGLDPRNLVVEITETAVMKDIHANIDRLHSLRDLGIRLALDDFGTGYSSLSHLREFPVDILKIAQPFIDRLHSSEPDLMFVRMMIELGHAMEMQVVAEGVETMAQAATLSELGCDLAQGYLYSPAKPAVEIFPSLGGKNGAGMPRPAEIQRVTSPSGSAR